MHKHISTYFQNSCNASCAQLDKLEKLATYSCTPSTTLLVQTQQLGTRCIIAHTHVANIAAQYIANLVDKLE